MIDNKAQVAEIDAKWPTIRGVAIRQLTKQQMLIPLVQVQVLPCAFNFGKPSHKSHFISTEAIFKVNKVFFVNKEAHRE